MSVHEQFADDLALYALNALQGEERTALETHLEACGSCRNELENIRGDAALMALSAAGPRPPARSRQRLLKTIAREPRLSMTPSTERKWWTAIPWAVAATAIVVAGLLFRQNLDLKNGVAALQATMQRDQAELQRAKDVVATFTAPEAEKVTLTLAAAKTPPQPQGKAFYLSDKGRLIFLANNLAPLPPQKIYELWLIPTIGAPIPAGLFRPDAHGSANVVNPPLQPGVQAKAFAVTVEPEAGSSTPTMPILMMGAGE